MNRLTFLLMLICSTVVQSSLLAQPDVEKYLIDGQLDAGRDAITKHLKANPEDDQTRFGLGVLEFLQAVEHLGQSMHHYGVRSETNLPFLRIPVPKNKNPAPIKYEDTRHILKTLVRDLKRADKTLSQITSDDVKLPLHLFKYHLDWNKDGKTDASESFARVAAEYVRWNLTNEEYREVAIHFDRADVYWLRGYCNLICAMSEFLLAYDQQDSWDAAARCFFPTAVVKFEFLMEEDYDSFYWFSNLTDLIAGIHNLGMPLVDAERMKASHSHLMTTLQQSRLMWDRIQQETDNDLEWIPNPDQQSAVTEIQFDKEMVDGWYSFLDEAEAILKGEKLVVFWRGTDENRGVNLYRVFHEPRDFDIVLWIHGSGAAPFLEKGEVSSPETWRRFERIFRGDFIGFATWIN